jgi:hypothetical protein
MAETADRSRVLKDEPSLELVIGDICRNCGIIEDLGERRE